MKAMLAEGVHSTAAEGYATLMRDANQGLNDVNVAGDGRREWIIPGRIEVLGKHVDYAGGRSLLTMARSRLALDSGKFPSARSALAMP